MQKMTRFVIACLLVTLAACLPGPSAAAGVTVLPALKSAGLAGRLIFIRYNQTGNPLLQLDLSSGQVKTLFAPPNKSWLAAAEVSPDGKQILLAYAPPPPAGQIQLANTDLYLMPVDGSSAPKALVTRSAANESFFQPAWSPDGQAIYYTHNIPDPAARTGILSQIERLPLGGQAKVLAQHALWPRPSPDGTKVAFLAAVLNTSDNILSLMDANGGGPAAVHGAENFHIVDDHVFAPDGKSILFSAISDTPVSALPAPGWAWTLGVRPVSAHTNPSDWFRADLTSAKVTQVTHIQNVNMAAAYAPDGQKVAFLSQKGLFIMQPDGSALTQIASFTAMGSINWLP